ncbi:MAG: E3 binding domain-containing protein, partial [Bacteroidales bacterium]|nr:E3 binding domain-containing protein [Bacteroidales bacterium]
MAQVVIMPKQGQSVESCIVTEFKKKVGEKVAVGDVLFSYETDKASFEEESKFEGTVLACFFNDNDEIPCLTNVMVIGEPGESFEEFAPGGASQASEPAESPKAEVVSAETPATPASASGAAETAPVNTATSGTESPVSPRARKLAAEKGIDAAHLAGSGPGGRVIERDVLAAATAPMSGLAKAMMAEGGLQAPASGSGLGGMVKGSDLKTWKPSHTDIAGEGVEFTVEKMSNMRKLIA